MYGRLPAGKSGSRWLDRLRTAKGFPSDEATDLADAVRNPNTPATSQFQPAPSPTHGDEDHPELFTIVTDVLHDLFNFGGAGGAGIRAKSKKSARKQSNPRVCAFEAGDENERNSRAEAEAAAEADLAGFSSTEVTVIDTSYEVWKSEKLLYRKKNAWRARDKKGSGIKRLSSSSKKRKNK